MGAGADVADSQGQARLGALALEMLAESECSSYTAKSNTKMLEAINVQRH